MKNLFVHRCSVQCSCESRSPECEAPHQEPWAPAVAGARSSVDERGFTLSGRSAEDGFTLVELMVVIVIIGLLATIVAINVIPATDTARIEKAKADISTIEQALEQYRLDNLTYPAGSDGLQALLNPPASLAQPQRYRRGGYIKKLPQDPWGRAYVYTVPGRKGAFDISSLGADGQPGGENENADIYSSEL
ncbi:type II secretion system major pseudopilin GspG [Sphingobium sp. YR768]|uniref:type II secretion system major pseudopilin GspG n=1 Tax=Sphingobium sp. YR768 TaxID=1884365 RepID=UPI0008D1E500|nr:type II secretion system major pseudopilin GspG [Sphingobium sp. YR768]SEQ70495.1 general secretion pathway protein G [Sphingobium sp. YR768]